MRRHLLASTALLALASQAHAEEIDTEVQGPVRTSTIDDGAPDAIVITEDGSVVAASGTAVIMDSNHAVSNDGDIDVSGGNGSIGILAEAGPSGAITNTGSITVDESYTPTDADNDGDLDGPFAQGSNRFGIRTDGVHTGALSQAGSITVQGNDSAGIWLGGLQSGDVVHDGITKITGDNSVGVRLEDVTGNVRLAGTVSAAGENSVAALFAGDIEGAIVVQGNVSATGYRFTTAPSDASGLDDDDLLQGGPALVFEGDVSGGIVLARAPSGSDPDDDDEDNDGIPDAEEGNAKVTSYGAAPAMLIGSAGNDVAIGPVGGVNTAYGLQIQGEVRGDGVYAGVDGNGLQIGGLGSDVSIANGIFLSGTVAASSLDSSATALMLGDGAATSVLRVSGLVEAKGGNAADAMTTAILIAEGASLSTIHNSGTISAEAAGDDGNAIAVRDLSGTLNLIENSGSILASGAEEGSGRNIAIDLSANTSGVIIRQTPASGTGPSIVGDVYLGSGDDEFDVGDGLFAGNAFLGEGDNWLKVSGDARRVGDTEFGSGDDVVTLRGTSRYEGNIDFGGGNDVLTLAQTASFVGGLANAGGLAIDIYGGLLDLSGAATIASLNVSDEGVLVATLDKDASEGTLFDITGTAAFEDGARLAVRLGDIDDAEGRYTVLQAGTLDLEGEIDLVDDLIPFLFRASLADDAAQNTLAVDIDRRTAEELGLNTSQATAYDAIFAALGNDEDIETAFLGISDGDQFRGVVGQLLPDHAGGTFEGVSLGLRTLARQVTDPTSPVYSFGGVDVLLGAAAWSSDKDIGSTARYDLAGLGFTAAAEIDNKLGSFGASVSWLYNDLDQGSDQNVVESDTYEFALYWRGEWDGLSAFGRGSYGFSDFDGRRTLQGTNDGEAFERNAVADWGGSVITGSAGVAYESGGRHLFVRPSVVIDYVRLNEDGHTSDGGGASVDLRVEERRSDELTLNGGMTVGIDFMGNGYSDRYWFRIESEGGWREVVGGELGATTAHFFDGESFTLSPEQDGSGWYGRLRAIGGGDLFEMGGEIGAEERHGNTALSLRGTVRMGF